MHMQDGNTLQGRLFSHTSRGSNTATTFSKDDKCAVEDAPSMRTQEALQ